MSWVIVAGQVSGLSSPPSDPASLEKQHILQLAQPAIHPRKPKFSGVSSATSLFLGQSLDPLSVFNLFICHLTNSSHTWNKVGHCQLLKSQAQRVSSYTCFPSRFLNKFQTEALESITVHVSQETSTGSAGSRMGLDTAHRQLGHKCVTEGSLLSTATTEVTCWEFCL